VATRARADFGGEVDHAEQRLHCRAALGRVKRTQLKASLFPQLSGADGRQREPRIGSLPAICPASRCSGSRTISSAAA
jgi:hypothetical protein